MQHYNITSGENLGVKCHSRNCQKLYGKTKAFLAFPRVVWSHFWIFLGIIYCHCTNGAPLVSSFPHLFLQLALGMGTNHIMNDNLWWIRLVHALFKLVEGLSQTSQSMNQLLVTCATEAEAEVDWEAFKCLTVHHCIMGSPQDSWYWEESSPCKISWGSTELSSRPHKTVDFPGWICSPEVSWSSAELPGSSWAEQQRLPTFSLCYGSTVERQGLKGGKLKLQVKVPECPSIPPPLSWCPDSTVTESVCEGEMKGSAGLSGLLQVDEQTRWDSWSPWRPLSVRSAVLDGVWSMAQVAQQNHPDSWYCGECTLRRFSHFFGLCQDTEVDKRGI